MLHKQISQRNGDCDNNEKIIQQTFGNHQPLEMEESVDSSKLTTNFVQNKQPSLPSKMFRYSLGIEECFYPYSECCEPNTTATRQRYKSM